MARTRMANRAGASRARSSRTAGRPSRTSLARRGKPTTSLYVGDSSDSDIADDSDSSVNDDIADDDTDSGIDRPFDDDIETRTISRKRKRPTPRAQIPRRTARKATTAPNNIPSVTNTPRKGRGKSTSKSGAKNATGRRSQRRQRHTPTKRANTSTNSLTHIPAGFIPDWRDPRVPYDAWVDIFSYASDLGSETGWLLHAATICKAFAEPALAALYQNPSIRTGGKARKLVALLGLPLEETFFNYRSKIKAIHVNIETFPLGVIHEIVRPLHLLKELIIFSRLDQPPYRDLDKTIRWNYPEELFTALDPTLVSSESAEIVRHESSPIRLKSWEWSSRLLGGYVAGVEDIARVHMLPTFSSITRLSFTNFQVPSLQNLSKTSDEAVIMQAQEEDNRVIDSIVHAISQLESLKHLIFESSTVMTDRLLGGLPKDLVHLELINCWEVRSDVLADFLHTHGHNMRSLTLLHNQSLDLAFLPSLAETCPDLRELRVNMSYYRHHESIDDSDPMYEQALLPDQVPMWPTRLRLIEIEHVRHWSPEAAKMFLQSLIDSAPYLTKLRHLAIKTMLNIPWQDRANMRREWSELMSTVFLRPWAPPKSHKTLRFNETRVVTPTKKQKKPDSHPPSRRSGRIAAHASDSDAETRGGSHRLRNNTRPLYRDPDTDEDEQDSDFSGTASYEESGRQAQTQRDTYSTDHEIGEVEERSPRQGMCHTVSVLFDNQKLRELQYGMEDFNDDENESSGEEWDGDEDIDDGIFVWR